MEGWIWPEGTKSSEKHSTDWFKLVYYRLSNIIIFNKIFKPNIKLFSGLNIWNLPFERMHDCRDIFNTFKDSNFFKKILFIALKDTNPMRAEGRGSAPYPSWLYSLQFVATC